MSGTIPPLPQYVLMAWYLVKHRGFILTVKPSLLRTRRMDQTWSSPGWHLLILGQVYEGVSKSLRTGSPDRELQLLQVSANRRSCIAILWVSLVSFYRHNPLCCFSTSAYYCCCLFRYRLSPGTSGYTLVCRTCASCGALERLNQSCMCTFSDRRKEVT
jgi:hypothetical protein